MALVNILEKDAPVKDNAQSEPEPQPAQVEELENAAVEETATKEQRYAGRFKSVEDLESGYESLNSKLGSTGKEIGDLNSRLEQQTAQLNELVSQRDQSDKQQSAVDYGAIQSELAAKYENGDIDFQTYSRESNALTASIVQEQAQAQMSKVLEQAESKFNQTLSERDEEQLTKRFHEVNPDFATLQKSGELDRIAQENEFISEPYQAYLQFKANESFEAGKKAVTEEISGSEPAKKVASSPGSAIKNEKPVEPGRPPTKAESFRSGLDAWNSAGS